MADLAAKALCRPYTPPVLVRLSFRGQRRTDANAAPFRWAFETLDS